MTNVINVCTVADYLPIDELKVHPENPRTISRDRLDDLKRSIVEKGFYEPILVWRKDNIILSGNHRLRAVKELLDDGYVLKTAVKPRGKVTKPNCLPVVFEDCDDGIAEAILFETNNPYAEWIDEKLKAALQAANEAGKDLKSFGFTTDDIDSYVAKALKDAGADSLGDDDIDDEPKKKKGLTDADVVHGGEEQKVLVLTATLHTRLMDIFKNVAWQLDKEWKEGDSLFPAIQAFTDFCFENGIPDVAEFIKERG